MNTIEFENEFWTDRGVYDDTDADRARGEWPESRPRKINRAELSAAGLPAAEVDNILRLYNYTLTRPEYTGDTALVRRARWYSSIKPDADVPAIELTMTDGRTRWIFLECDRRRGAGDIWRVIN